MPDSPSFLDDFHRYAGLIEAALRGAPLGFVAESESAGAVQVERGVAYASAVLDPQRRGDSIDLLLEAGDRPDLDHLGSLAVVDRTGHRRPVYRGVLIYSALQAFRLRYETLPAADFGRWEEGLRPWADLLEAELARVSLLAGASPQAGAEGDRSQSPRDSIPAARGAAAAEAAWMALGLQVAGKVYVRDAWTDLASDFFGKLARAQDGGGAFLTPSAADNPETHWYHELAILHAAASYAVQAEDRPLAAAVARNTRFHLNQTQPDHATHQPWGLFAFLWNPQTRTLADGMLHSATALSGAAGTGPSLLTSILLVDALYCLRLYA